MPDPELMTTSQVLELLQIGRTKLWELVREAAFPAYRIGEGRNSSLRYRRADVLGWLERNRVNGVNGVNGLNGAGPDPERLPPQAR